jgi:late competence protein required for DNA uptake (superfamily II DNA/RNA helicase)
MTSGSAARIWAKAQADRCKTPGCKNNGELIMGMRAALCTECIAMPKQSEAATFYAEKADGVL